MSTIFFTDEIKATRSTQARLKLNQEIVAEYADVIRAGGIFPPVVVFDDGSDLWLADGFHRFHGHRAAEVLEISCEVRNGTERDAILYSVGANTSHGLRRTNEDKRSAVETLLKDAEWSKWSGRDIAKACGVSHGFVDSLKSSLATVASDNPKSSLQTVCSDKPDQVNYTTKHGTVAVMKTANIGKAQQAPAELPHADPAELPLSASDHTEDLRDSLKSTLADNEMMGRVFDADDRLKASMDEAVRQKAIADSAQRQFHAQQGKVVALAEQVTYWKNRCEKAEKMLRSAA